MRRTVKGTDARARLEATFATLCDYVEMRNGGSKVMPPRARVPFLEYKCQDRRIHPVSVEAKRYFDSAAFRRETLTNFISTASFEIYAARSETMRHARPRTDRE